MPRPWYLPEYNHLRFVDVYGNLDKFLDDYNTNVGVYFYQNTAPLSTNYIKTLYFLLYAKFGNTPIVNQDVNQFKFKLFATVFSYGPAWQKKLSIQDSLNALTEADIVIGAKQIYNHAFNPSSAPSTDTTNEIEYVNDQNVTKHKKGIVEAYAYLWDNLHASATEEFLNRFKPLFSSIVSIDQCAPFYIEDENLFDDNI